MEMKTYLRSGYHRCVVAVTSLAANPHRSISVGWVDGVLEALERMSFTKANHRAAFVADLAMCIGLFAASFFSWDMYPLLATLSFGFGLLLFSLVEYCFHRWLFHGLEHAMERGHRRHHEDPKGIGSLPFFLPPVALILLAGLFAQVILLSYALLLTSAIACAYFAYGQCHELIHRTRFRHPLARKWAASHQIHHHHPDRNFGVTSPLWDIVFGTRHISRSRKP